jgi:hypothetical protein
LKEPQTVCTSEKCKKYAKLSDGEYILRYPQVCCNTCFPVPKESLWALLRFGQFVVDHLGALYLCQAFDEVGVHKMLMFFQRTLTCLLQN